MPTKAANTGNGYPSGMKNRIINGGMDISQRGTSFVSPTNTSYILDRWRVDHISDGAITITQNSDVPSNNEFQNSLRLTVNTADASIASGQYCAIGQTIEGYNIRDLIGRTFTVSFWVKSTKTGIHCFRLSNTGADRSYVTEYIVNASLTWEYKTITIAGGLPTAGTWNYTNGGGLFTTFMQAAGSTFQTTAGAWNTGNLLSTSNQVNLLDTIGNIFAITGVQLELGPVATPFEHRLYSAELALCQRYYRRGFNQGCVSVAYSTTAISFRIPVGTPFRTNVTANLISGAGLTDCLEKIGVINYTPTSFSPSPAGSVNYAHLDFSGSFTLGAPVAIATAIFEASAEL